MGERGSWFAALALTTHRGVHEEVQHSRHLCQHIPAVRKCSPSQVDGLCSYQCSRTGIDRNFCRSIQLVARQQCILDASPPEAIELMSSAPSCPFKAPCTLFCGHTLHLAMSHGWQQLLLLSERCR